MARPIRICAVPDCGRRRHSSLHCKAHDARVKRCGDVRADIPIGRGRIPINRVVNGRKNCNRCGESTAVEDLSSRSADSSGIGRYCRWCHAKMITEYKYRLPSDGVSKLIDSQGGRCAACGDIFSDGDKIVIDHDHFCCGPPLRRELFKMEDVR